MTAPRFDALTFDCYGTLIDWERGLIAGLAGWRRRAQQPFDDEALLAAFAALETRVQTEQPGLVYPAILTEVLRRLAMHFECPATDLECQVFAATIGDWPAFPDTKAALANLRQSYRLVILSNVDRASFARTQRHLGVEFDAIVTAEDVGAYKPDLRMFHALLERLGGMGVSRDRTLHVAQSLYHDHVPARSVGLRTAFIDRRGGRKGGATPNPVGDVTPDYSVDSLARLATLLLP